jgi:hypothetical protein
LLIKQDIDKTFFHHFPFLCMDCRATLSLATTIVTAKSFRHCEGA